MFCFALGLAAAAAAQAPVTAVRGDVEVAVLSHPVERGERLTAADFVVERRQAGLVHGALGPREADGLEAARRLPASSVVRRDDLVTPQLVRRGESVTITLVSGGLSISSAGRALTGGGAGEPVRVVSLVTNRTLDGIVAGEGRVRVAAH